MTAGDDDRQGKEAEQAACETLRTRARELARIREDREEGAAGTDCLQFIRGREIYAVPVLHLSEVAPVRVLAHLPGTPAFIAGIISLRGRFVSVVDLAVLLGLPPVAVPRRPRAVVLSDGKMTFALLADRVEGIVRILDRELEAGAPALQHIDPRYAAGVTPDRVLLLDGKRILSDPQLIVNQ